MNEELFPSYDEYMKIHSEHNLKKLCLEIQEFCMSIYATLESEEEKQIFFDAINKPTTF